MLYTPLTRQAMQIAYATHHGQVDKAGVPYIFHPMHLAEQMVDEVSVCVALLHDTLEDSSVSLSSLSAHFPPEVIRALKLLTHESEIPYFEYIERLKADPIARRVKLADLKHNSDETRYSGQGYLDDKGRARRRAKYAKAIEMLEGGTNNVQ